MIIDSHQHFWHYDPVEFDWIDESMQSIRTNFLPGMLEPVIRASGIDGVVTVQARQSEEETEWLLDQACQNDFIKGIVGWLPLAAPQLDASLEKYAGENMLKGIRHVIQGEPDPDFILRADFNRGIEQLKKQNLVYDILVLESQLPNTIKFVDLHPDQIFVLDHIAKPLIGRNELSPWRERILELARRENVHCKLSGMVTEADFQDWTDTQLHPYFEVVLEAFGPERLLFGSDWPVCLVATTYLDWVNLVRREITALSQFEQNQIMGGNAERIYKLRVER